jgi:hypothetical protein
MSDEARVPLLRSGVLQYVESATVEITYKDGGQVRIEGTDLRIDAEVSLPTPRVAIDMQEIPHELLPMLEVPKIHLVIQPTANAGSTLTLSEPE